MCTRAEGSSAKTDDLDTTATATDNAEPDNFNFNFNISTDTNFNGSLLTCNLTIPGEC